MAKKQQGNLEKTLDQALCMPETQGRGEIACSIRPIIFENLKRGGAKNRVCIYLETNHEKTPVDYVYHVAGYYEELCDYLCQVQEEKSASVWQPLFEKMQWWAFNYLRRKNFPPIRKHFNWLRTAPPTPAATWSTLTSLTTSTLTPRRLPSSRITARRRLVGCCEPAVFPITNWSL